MRTSDPVEQLVEVVIAEQVSDALTKDADRRNRNLAIELGNVVNDGLARLARAMR